MSDRARTDRSFLWQEAYELPQTITPLVGRADELAALQRALSSGERLLTITGSAGIGKTRLAVELAQTLAGSLGFSATLRLAPSRDAAVVPKLLATVCAFDGWADLPIDRFPARLQGVVVLDGFDHVHDAGASVVALRERCPELFVVVTSRVALSLPDEFELPLTPVDRDAACQLLQAHRLHGQDLDGAVIDVAHRNPLALELIGGLLLGGQLIAGDNAESTGDLLNDLIERSIDVLPSNAQHLFERLCVSAGGFEPSAIASLAEVAPPVKGELSAFIDAMTTQGLLTPAQSGRFEIPTAVREVGLVRLNASGDLAAARLAYATHMLERAKSVGDLLGGARRNAAVAWFEREYSGLRLAFGAFVQMNRVQQARELAVAHLPYWLIRRRFREARRWLTVALDLTRPPYTDDLELELLVALGLLELYLGNDAAARARALAGARPGMPVPQTGWRGAALATLGMLAAREGDFERAKGLYRVYLEATQAGANGRVWSPQLRAITRLALAAAHMAQGELEDAEFHATMALKRAISLGDPLFVGYARVNLGAVALAKSDVDAALELYRDGTLLLFEQPHTGAASAGVLGLARIALLMNVPVVTAQLLQLARTLLEAGSPVPPFLINFDPDELQAMLDSASPRARDRQVNEAPVARLSDAVTVLAECVDVLTGVQVPVEPLPARNERGGLSSRELEALCLAAGDMTDLEIADALFISKRTASDHMRNVIGKLGVHSRTGAVARALREGWCS